MCISAARFGCAFWGLPLPLPATGRNLYESAFRTVRVPWFILVRQCRMAQYLPTAHRGGTAALAKKTADCHSTWLSIWRGSLASTACRRLSAGWSPSREPHAPRPLATPFEDLPANFLLLIIIDNIQVFAHRRNFVGS